MRCFLSTVAAAAATIVVGGGVALAQPAPQLNEQDLINRLDAPVSPLGSEGCEPGFERGETGECEPLKGDTNSFNLGRPGQAAPAAPAGAAPATRATLQRTIPAPPPPRVADLLLTFQLDSVELTQQGIANARVFAAALKNPRLADARFEIEGHTDASGSSEYNMVLSQRRAEAVKRFLVSQGIDADRLVAKGYGFTRLANVSEPLSGENRRVVARRIQ